MPRAKRTLGRRPRRLRRADRETASARCGGAGAPPIPHRVRHNVSATGCNVGTSRCAKSSMKAVRLRVALPPANLYLRLRNIVKQRRIDNHRRAAFPHPRLFGRGPRKRTPTYTTLLSRPREPYWAPLPRYFPTQNSRNNRPSTSSRLTAPISSSSACTAARTCTAATIAGTPRPTSHAATNAANSSRAVRTAT